MGHESVAVIPAHCELDILKFEYWWGRDFPPPSISAVRPNKFPVNWLPGIFPGVIIHLHPYSVDVTERVNLYLYTPFVQFVAGYRFNLTFTSI